MAQRSQEFSGLKLTISAAVIGKANWHIDHYHLRLLTGVVNNCPEIRRKTRKDSAIIKSQAGKNPSPATAIDADNEITG